MPIVSIVYELSTLRRAFITERHTWWSVLQLSSICSDHAADTSRVGQVCYENHFCPTGTGDPRVGQMADDGVNRGLTSEEANPFLGVDTLKYLGDEVRLSHRRPSRRLPEEELRKAVDGSGDRAAQDTPFSGCALRQEFQRKL